MLLEIPKENHGLLEHDSETDLQFWSSSLPSCSTFISYLLYTWSQSELCLA